MSWPGDCTPNPRCQTQVIHRLRSGCGTRMSVNVVGISAHFHDAAACILVDGRLAAAAQKERFSRRKHDPSLPKAAFRFCLDEAGLTIADIDCVAYYEDPVEKLDRQLWSALPPVPSLAPEALFRLNAMRPEREIRELLGYAGPIEFLRHHESHAAILRQRCLGKCGSGPGPYLMGFARVCPPPPARPPHASSSSRRRPRLLQYSEFPFDFARY